MNATMDMMAVAMLTRSNSSDDGLYDIEEFENNDAWGVQHGTVMANIASHVLFGTALLAPGSDGIPGNPEIQLVAACDLTEELKSRVPEGTPSIPTTSRWWPRRSPMWSTTACPITCTSP